MSTFRDPLSIIAFFAAVIGVMWVGYFTVARLFHVPSANMEPTAPPGSYVVADTTAYRSAGPKRGDVVIFTLNDTAWIKRVVGLPGDRIQMKDGVLVVNGQPSEQTKLRVEIGENEAIATIYRERMPDGAEHLIQDLMQSEFDSTQEFLVPKDRYFVLGDNRDNSVDSRDQTYVGYVSRTQLQGRVWAVYIPWFDVKVY
jgi:signal peptidase I